MSDEPKRHLRALAEAILADQPDDCLSPDENVRCLHANLLDLAQDVWLAGYIAGKNGRMQVENPYSVLSDADREFVKALLAQLEPVYEKVLAEHNGATIPCADLRYQGSR